MVERYKITIQNKSYFYILVMNNWKIKKKFHSK